MTSAPAQSWRAFTAYFLGLLLLLSGAASVFGFALNGYTWPATTQIRMHLDLSHAFTSLQDGSTDWNASASDALNIWNQYIDTVKFVADAPSGSSGANGANDVLFSTTVYGDTWPTRALAVTIKMSNQGSSFTEVDVLFNDNLKWDSYRGPLQGSGLIGTYDFHRVALHEFGHVLGLDHPDQHGQSVVAIMNSIISDLDHLADDDIAGARSLYGLRITSPLNPASIRSGDNFSYQITANNNPSSYAANGLPPGLQLNGASGLISGSCPTSGIFPVDITVQGESGTATARVQITITPLPIGSYSSASVQVGTNFAYQISAGNNPTSYDATGLPSGLQVNGVTGLISGTPQVSGNFTVRLFARSASSEAAGNLSLQVMPPRITSAYPPVVGLGDPLSFQITATNNPTSFGASGLPPGLQINASSGLISGTSTAAGDFSVTVTAQTPYGAATATILVTIRPPRITSFPPPPQDIGTSYNYQITASNHPSSFSATGLPAGLVLDSTTGKITGVAELSGTYQVNITAVGTTGTATGTITITVAALDVSDPPLKKLSLSVYGSIVADPIRPRVYAPVGTNIAVIDTNSLSVIKTIDIGSAFYADFGFSPDGNKLWVTDYYNSRIRGIDLNTLTVTTTITTTLYPRMIRAGADGYLYVTDYNHSYISQVDPASGATLTQFDPRSTNAAGSCAIDTSPDHKTLYVAGLSNGAPVGSYDISAGGAPALIQRVDLTGTQSFGRKLAVNPTNGSIAFMTQNGNPATIDPTQVRSGADLNSIQGSFASPGIPSNLVYSFDGSLLFQAMQQRSRIDVFRTNSGQLARTITLPNRAVPGNDNNSIVQGLAVDQTNSYLFVVSNSGSATGLYIYSLLPPPQPPTPPKSLLNIATRLETQGGDNALIGGFIVTGQGPKQLALRAIGPSLPVAGKLADPVLQLYDSTGTLIAQNDNWNAHRADVIATGLAPSDEHEAVTTATLQPGSYTAVVRGVNDSTGVALVEGYDLSPNSGSKLANISTRGKVEAGDNVMIGGFILGGDQLTNVIVRAIGPSLANVGVPDALIDPSLEVYDGNGVMLASDDNWRENQEQLLLQTGLAPADDREAAIALSLQPGAYTAIVRGKSDSVGVGLVEVYNLDSQ